MKRAREEYERMPLRAHAFLEGIPLDGVWRVELPGGPEGLTLPEITRAVGFGSGGGPPAGAATRLLFRLREAAGRLFGWDDARDVVAAQTFVPRLTEEDRARSLSAPGTEHGIVRDLYVFEGESLGEVINRTVHAFVSLASEPTAGGYALYLAVYVRKLGWFTPVYMAAIRPFRYLVVYPSMIEGMRRRWAERYPG